MSWPSKRLKHLTLGPPQYGLNVPSTEYETAGVRLLRTSDVDNAGRLTDIEPVYVDSTIAVDAPLASGDILLSRSGTVGRAFRITDESLPATHAGYLVRFRPSTETEPRYLEWAMRTRGFADQVSLAGVQSTIANVNAQKYAAMYFPGPPLDIQRRIADFLDRETARIDALIDKKRRLIDLLDQRVPSLTEDRVQGLLRKYRRIPLKYLAHESNLRVGHSKPPELLSVSIHLGVVPRSTMTDKPARADSFSNYKVCRPGDIVINRMRAFQGGVGVTRQHGMVSSDYTVLQLAQQLDPDFTHHLLRSPWFVGEMTYRLRGIGTPEQGNVRTPRVSFNDLGEIPFPVPPISDQRTEESILAQAVDSTFTLKHRLSDQLALLAEYREALITAAVTGEIDVDTFDGEARVEGVAG